VVDLPIGFSTAFCISKTNPWFCLRTDLSPLPQHPKVSILQFDCALKPASFLDSSLFSIIDHNIDRQGHSAHFSRARKSSELDAHRGLSVKTRLAKPPPVVRVPHPFCSALHFLVLTPPATTPNHPIQSQGHSSHHLQQPPPPTTTTITRDR
jgi:hypothetical protein